MTPFIMTLIMPFIFFIIITGIGVYVFIKERKKNKELKEIQKQQPDTIVNKSKNINIIWFLFFILSISMFNGPNYGFLEFDGSIFDFLNIGTAFIYFGSIYFIYQFFFKYLKGIRIVKRKNIDNLK